MARSQLRYFLSLKHLNFSCFHIARYCGNSNGIHSLLDHCLSLIVFFFITINSRQMLIWNRSLKKCIKLIRVLFKNSCFHTEYSSCALVFVAFICVEMLMYFTWAIPAYNCVLSVCFGVTNWKQCSCAVLCIVEVSSAT